MSDITILTERDRALVEAGYWPIDVDPARVMSEAEIASAMLSDERRERVREMQRAGYRALAHKGYIAYSKCDVGPDVPGGGAA